MLAARSLAFAFAKSAQPVLRGLDFEIGRGELVAFVGPAGVGKTTLHKILTGLIRDYSGGVSLLGKDYRDWGRDFFEKIGAGFQTQGIFSRLTALENLTCMARLYAGPTEAPQALLAKLGLADHALPVAKFSDGMKTRLGIARSLLHRPEIVFLDEPLAGLDAAGTAAVVELLRAHRAAGRTAVLFTREETSARACCDRVVALAEGKS